MRKSSLGGRPSISGVPVRVRHENAEGQDGRPRSTSSKMRSSGSQSRQSGGSMGRPSHGAWGASNRFSMTSKNGRGMPSSGRTSNIGVRGRCDILKDPRPISDKAYQHQCTRNILDFLIRNNYPHAISQKLLAAPASKDFFKMFEFVLDMISADYTMGAKKEEEVPRILKMLGYPFNVSKTYLYSVGSPHVWPNLSAALNWMIDLVELTEGINEDGGVDTFIFNIPLEDDGEGESQIEEARILFDYCEKTYCAFMTGSDTFEEYDEELKALLQQKYQGRNIEEVLEENRKLEEDLLILGQVGDRLHRVQDSVVVGRQNLQKYQNYCAEMDTYKRSLAAKYKASEEDCAMLETEFQLKQQQLGKLREMFENQQIMPTDVARMKEESENLKRQIKELETEEESLDAQCFKVNIDMAKISEKVASEVAAYNASATDLKLIPDSAENANGQDYSLRPSCTSNMNNDIEHIILPKFLQMKKQAKEDIRRGNKQKFQRKCEHEQLQESVNETMEEVAVKKEALLKLEEKIEALKQLSQKENKSRLGEKSRRADRVIELGIQIKEAETIQVQEELKCQNILKERETLRKKFNEEFHMLKETTDIIRNSIEQSKEDFTVDLENMVEMMEEENVEAERRLVEVEKEQEDRKLWLEEIERQLNKYMNKE